MPLEDLLSQIIMWQGEQMSEFGKAVDQNNGKNKKTRFGTDFIKLSNEHQSVVRILDAKPEVSWSHFVPKAHHAFPKANNGKGMSFMCPGMDTCPICAWNKQQKSKDSKTKDVINASKKYTFNVLDRTSVKTCPSCGAEYYEIQNNYPDECECGEKLDKIEEAPRNKIQIMQKGKRVIDQLKALEEQKDFGDVREYDIRFHTMGQGTESMTTCIPSQKAKLDLVKILGKDWEEKKYNIKDVVTPLSAESISKILSGEDYYSVVKNTTTETEE
jgi:hypothetical protein